jgi:hypothetical protein
MRKILTALVLALMLFTGSAGAPSERIVAGLDIEATANSSVLESSVVDSGTSTTEGGRCEWAVRFSHRIFRAVHSLTSPPFLESSVFGDFEFRVNSLVREFEFCFMDIDDRCQFHSADEFSICHCNPPHFRSGH